MNFKDLPKKQGLYDPSYEHDACGVGVVCNINGECSYDMVEKGIEVLERMTHRGAVGADPQTGDGAGILVQIPHEFFQKICAEEKIILPEKGKYGTGIVFMPQDKEEEKSCTKIFEKYVKEEGLQILGWRDVPHQNNAIGKTALKSKPSIKQIFISDNNKCTDQQQLERKLYIIRKQVSREIRENQIEKDNSFYVSSLSSSKIVYKGLLMPNQLKTFYDDLRDERFKSCFALVHSRYSTNTFPTWNLAQPFRFLAHNGEINTLRGNLKWMHARESLLKSEVFGPDIEKIKPVTIEGRSDSATLDNIFELLVLSGRSLEHAMMMMVPAVWENNDMMDKDLVEFFKYHSCLMEPWDGPAALLFTDGVKIGAVLDRNGLRPARYIVTKSGLCVMASELGVLDIPSDDIKVSGRLEPGKMFLIDTLKGTIISDDEIKKNAAAQKPYGEWNKKHMVDLNDLPKAFQTSVIKPLTSGESFKIRKSLGYTREDLRMLIKPMAEEGIESTGSMGNDTPHAVLSKNPQPLYNYFKQLFAQVTNPPIDPIREEMVMSLECFIGRQGNILNETEEHAKKLRVTDPIISSDDILKIKNNDIEELKTKTISILFDVTEKGFKSAIDRICLESEQAINEGYTFIILSDKGISKDKASLPALLAVGAVHNHLISKLLRTKVAIVLESAEPREVHHFALLFGYGCDCVNPYMAFSIVREMVSDSEVVVDEKTGVKNYRKAVQKGILKILSKMGISTLRSYKGAQIFEALGLADDVIDKCFTGTASRIGGAGMKEIAAETIMRHIEAFEGDDIDVKVLPSGGRYQWKKDGETHLWSPEAIALLQDAVRKESYSIYKEFAGIINDQKKQPVTLRSMLKFTNNKPIDINQVEPASEIVKRFVTGAMSFGSISGSAHQSLAIAMNRLGGKSNSGEGGEDPVRFNRMPNGDLARSAIKQVASGRFGVNANYLANADEIQIKIAQGAKPGEGGQLPGHKVSAVIARTRYTTAGVTLISPPPHHDIYSIEDLAQLIFDLKNSNPRARISVKLVSEVGVGTVAAGVAKGHADMILISGGDGGTGASPRTSIMHAGLPWELGLSETHQTLVLNDLRSRVRLQTDGQLRTGRDVAMAAILGAEEYGFATGALIVLGCVMLRHCHLNNCALGIATQDSIFKGKFPGKPEYIVSYLNFVSEELREIMAELGIKKIDDLVGRTEMAETNTEILPWKAKGLDLSKILYKPIVEDVDTICTIKQDHCIDHVMDKKLIELARPALDGSDRVDIEMDIVNTDRTVGAMLSGEVCNKFGESDLPEDTIKCKFKGVAGQSFGAFISKGMTFELEGLANDYVGKGISGGKIIIYPDKNAGFEADKNIIIGNTTFYGAIRGEAYISGIAGERFCIRNSGLNGVVEGVGDHGCEYMTGGRVVILGKTGRNFAAGMSGGIAYVYDEDGRFNERCNKSMVELEKPLKEDIETIRILVNNHVKYTGSKKGEMILDNFQQEKTRFVKVMSSEYKKILETRKMEQDMDLGEASDG
ncbi:MAG: glutamate synthase large subunit [Candidatus Omnitrophica bacterium]|nr:glutamate synthase large subunit [Candidatus Omnitrophota bacterium]